MSRIMKMLALFHGFFFYFIKTFNKQRGMLSSLAFFFSSNVKKGSSVGKFHLGGIRFLVRPTDWCAFQEIILENEYAITRNVLQRSAVSRPIILDLGANIGLFAVYILSIEPAASVLSVEASKDTYQVLEKNRNLNRGCEWDILNAAVSDSDGYLSFEEGVVSTSGKLSSAGNVQVKSLRLASILKNYNDEILLIKMDIEGAEEGVIADSKDILFKVKNLIIEIHPNICNADNVVSILRECYDKLYFLPGRRSSKPLLLATNDIYDLEVYDGNN